MRDDPFQKELRPGSAIEFGRPIGQLFRSRTREQITSAERTIGNHSDAAFPGKRQNPLFRFAFHQ